MSGLAALADLIRNSRGVGHKRDIAAVMAGLGLSGRDAVPVGDDTAALPDGDGYLLFAIEGFVADFVAADPYFAGYCGVMVNVSDIAAMGGKPTAIVNAFWSDGPGNAAPILAGLRDASARYGVPVVGGHSNMRSPSGQLAVAILGRAETLITSFGAKPGDLVIVATDLRGRFRDPFPYWDASSDAPAARLRADLDILPALARDGLVTAGKDISMAGAIGTALMLLEASSCGGTLFPHSLPCPGNTTLERWLTAFPSYGFVLTAEPQNADEIIARFAAREIACRVVGHVEHGSGVNLAQGDGRVRLWDFADPLIGCGSRATTSITKAVCRPVESMHA